METIISLNTIKRAAVDAANAGLIERHSVVRHADNRPTHKALKQAGKGVANV